MLIQELFRRATIHCAPVTQSIATELAPAILREFAAIPALGGSGKLSIIQEPETQVLLETIPAYTPEELQIFSAKGFDQSLSTHLINGLFAGMYLAERLPEHKTLKPIELQVWVLGYTVHDYTKAYGRKVSAGQLAIARQLVSKLGERLAFDCFMEKWQVYLDDIVFVAQNTQTVQGANLNLRDYQLQLDKRQREIMRMLSSVTDLLVHITSPSDVLHRDARGRDLAYNLRQKLDMLFSADHAPRLAYHKLLEVRGLLSNLLNNALIDVLSEQGYKAFLFFPEGVIYLAPREVQAQVNIEAITKAAWKRVTSLLTGVRQREMGSDDEDSEEKDDEEGGGLRMRRSKDYMRVPAVLYELLNLENLIEMGRQTALAVRNSKTAARFGAEQAEERGLNVRMLSMKEKETYYREIGSKWATQQGLPTDVRVDQLAEFLVFLRYRVFSERFSKLQGVTAILLDALGLANNITTERADRQRGGTPTGWFYVAARYVQSHPELEPSELDTITKSLAVHSLQFIEAQELTPPRESKNEIVFLEYARSMIEIDGILAGASKESLYEQFAMELRRYIQSKETRKAVCSLCASPYEAEVQEASTILFKPQQYSNKSPLDTSQLKRGICPICSLEMMLRIVQQGLPRKDTQEKKAINLYLYPTYFFTTETAQVVKLFFNRLRDLSLYRLIYSHLEKQEFSHRNLITYEDFIVDDDTPNVPMKGGWKPQYSDEDQAALFFLTLYPMGQKPTETDAWILPTFYALALPLLLGVKCVATPSFATLYGSANDFHETTRIDGGHQFARHLLKKECFRVDETPEYVERLLRVYSLHLDVYGDDSSAHWGQLTNVTKDLTTDPLYVFQYYDRRQRRTEEDKKKGKSAKLGTVRQNNNGIPPQDQQRYMGVYFAIGGNQHMDYIGRLVNAYGQFYRADWDKLDSAYAVLRPLGTAIKVVVESDPSTGSEDLLLLVSGAVNDDQERVRSDHADGFDPIITNRELGDYKIRLALSRQKIEDFARLFINECFASYCNGDRSVLRERANRIRSAARFYYLVHYGRNIQQKV
jgi:CRISPR-associated protein Csc3